MIKIIEKLKNMNDQKNEIVLKYSVIRTKKYKKIRKVKYSRYVQCQQKYFSLISIIGCRPAVIKKK